MKKPSSRIFISYSFITILLLAVCYLVLPTLLNYAPGSINTEFDVKMSYISYTQQFLLIAIGILLLLLLFTKLSLRDIDQWYINRSSPDYNTDKKLINIRKKCVNLPYTLFISELILPTIVITGIIFFTGSHDILMIMKIFILIVTLVLALSTSTYMFSKHIYDEILSSTYKEGFDIGIHIGLKTKIFIQILPFFIIVLLLSSFIGYSRTVKAEADAYFKIYNDELNKAFDTNTVYSISQIEQILENIVVYENNTSKFILLDDNVISILGASPSNFMISYTKEISSNYNGRIYDSYGVDIQGASIILQSESGYCYVCISYSISEIETFYILVFDFIALLFVIIIVLYYFSNSISKDIIQVTEGLNNICNTSEPTYNQKLPVISNDEIGNLVTAFNKVQNVNIKHLNQLKENQNMLVEKERLASLGQMIGGIAHNLKTPIMSVSGAVEGLSDLIKEYESSVGDADVTVEDHHAIAADMRTWTEKIKTHLSYMSDVITAVKGQAVTFSEEQISSFSIEEMLKMVSILMKHELNSALVSLNIQNNVSSDTLLYGNINSLVQVVNNIISNSIQASVDATNKTIDLGVNQINNNIIISIKDYGCGIPKSVQDTLFKKMVTTKGKNGTGLGLFMSYSNIKAHFNGDITFQSEEGKGTKFDIILPL